MTTRTRTAVALLLVAGLALAGCSLGEKKDLTDRVIGSVERLREAGPHAGEVAIDFRVSEMPGLPGGGSPPLSVPPGAVGAAGAPGAGAAAGAAAGLGGAGLRYAAVVDAGAGRAELRPAPEVDPIVIFDNGVVFARRTGSGSSRPWAALDFGELDRVETPSLEAAIAAFGPTTAGLIDPNVVLGLVAGALSGSLDDKGPATVDGQPVRRFDVNVSIDKAEVELDLREEERDIGRRMLRSIGVTDDVLPARVWLTPDGDLVRAEVRFPQEPAPRVEFETVYRVTVGAAAARPRVPRSQQVLAVESPTELVRGLKAGN